MNTEMMAGSITHKLQTAWNNGDGAAYGAAFTDDADFVDIRGDHHQSKIAISKGHQAILDSIYKGSVTTISLLQVKTISPDAMLAHAKQKLDAPSGPLAGTNETTMSLVLVKQSGEWRIASCHNTLVAAHAIDWTHVLAE